MTYDELALAATRLPPSQRLALIEILTRSLRRELSAAPDEASAAQLEHILQAAGPESPLHRLVGVARSTGDPIVQEDWKEDYTDYLIQKYGDDERLT